MLRPSLALHRKSFDPDQGQKVTETASEKS